MRGLGYKMGDEMSGKDEREDETKNDAPGRGLIFSSAGPKMSDMGTWVRTPRGCGGRNVPAVEQGIATTAKY